jgi:CheY-like chemotaxis protein
MQPVAAANGRAHDRRAGSCELPAPNGRPFDCSTAIVLCDLTMEGAREIVALLKISGARPHIILMSGVEEAELRQAAAEISADFVLAKPFDQSALRSVLERFSRKTPPKMMSRLGRRCPDRAARMRESKRGQPAAAPVWLMSRRPSPGRYCPSKHRLWRRPPPAG